MCLSDMINLSNEGFAHRELFIEKTHRELRKQCILLNRILPCLDKSANIWEEFSTTRSSIPYIRTAKKSLTQESEQTENVGLVRFELTIDGSLRHASVLQRVIINHQNFDELSMSSLTGLRKINSADPLFIICEHKERKDRWSPSPFRARPQPLGHAGT